MEGGIDHRKAISLAGLYLHTLKAIFLISSSASGGSHRLLFVTSNAASISSAPIPRRRIVPARLVNVSLRWPSGMLEPIAALPFARDFCTSRNSRRNHSGAFAIGASFLQRYISPLAWSEGATTIAPPSPLISSPGPNSRVAKAFWLCRRRRGVEANLIAIAMSGVRGDARC
jgi:hypothetical protein